MSSASEMLRERAREEQDCASVTPRAKMVLLHRTLARLYTDLAQRHDAQNLNLFRSSRTGAEATAPKQARQP
jgi:hypothetical protein